MIIISPHPLTGKPHFATLMGTIAERADAVRLFPYKNGKGDSLEGMAISLSVPYEAENGKKKDLPVDVTCFVPDEYPKIAKLKLKPKMSVTVEAELDAEGRTKISKATDIEIQSKI